MKYFAQVEGGAVVYVGVFSPDQSPGALGLTGEWVDVSDLTLRPGVDWTYANGEFSPPASA
jgi:hypothetical protein